jgi:thiosulfate/3-mercaptopyruvate sulfurtransferase
VSNLVSTAWLAENLSDPDLCILDCSWHLPATKRDAHAEFEAVHIAGAQFFDIDAISDKSTTLPHMLPTPEFFASEVRKLGAANYNKIICYDAVGLFSAARVWWMFKVFGHDNVAVLDGGLRKWVAEGRKTVSSPSSHRPADTSPSGVDKGTNSSSSPEGEVPEGRRGDAIFIPTFRPDMVKSIFQVASENTQIADARSPTRFRGEEPEPRPGVKPGHMPGARNLHYTTLLNPDSTLKSKKELAQIFASARINLEKPITTSCGSGVTAAILSLALTELSAKHHALYDGSWAEWGASGREIGLG